MLRVLLPRLSGLSLGPRVLASLAPLAPAGLQQRRGVANTKRSKISFEFKTKQVVAKRILAGRPYKLKNNKAAVARWMITRSGTGFKRVQAARNHLNLLNNARKRARKRDRKPAMPIEARLLRKLIPYHRKRYLR